MMKIISLLVFCALSLNSMAYAAKAREAKKAPKTAKILEKVNPKELHPSAILRIEAVKKSNKKTLIVLNNGSEWVYNDKDLFKEDSGWRIGDRVEILYVFFEGFSLRNVSCQGNIPVVFQNSSSKDISAHKIAEIKHDTKKSTATLVLDDDSKWFIGEWSSSWITTWRKGDRIMLTPQQSVFSKEDYLIINLDREEMEENVSNVRGRLLQATQKQLPNDENLRPAKTWKMTIAKAFQDKESMWIELDNHTMWKCPALKKEWKVNDEVIFEVSDEKMKFINLNAKEELPTALDKTNLENAKALTIIKISKDKKKLTLSDGSLWKAEAFSNFKNWEKDNRVLVSSLGYFPVDATTHSLVNIDQVAKKGIPLHTSAMLVQQSAASLSP